MRRVLIWLVTLILTSALKAEVNMAIQVPFEGIIIKPQLWNLIVTNTETSSKIKVTIGMVDAITNEPVLSATSIEIFLSVGATALSANNFAPIQYEYLSPVITNQDPDGFLPLGEYQVCYRLYELKNEVFELTGEEYINIIVEPVSPPLLNLPANNSESETNIPQFSWLPPAPMPMFNNLSYDFLLVEVNAGQTAEEATQQNMPVFITNNIADNFLNYPSSWPALDTGKLYAWQVKANNNIVFAAQSEVWTFKIKPVQTDSLTFSPIQYATLNNNENEQPIYHIDGNIVFLKFYSWDASETVHILLTNEQNEIVEDYPVNIKYGENYVKLQIKTGLVKGSQYRLSMTDLNDHTYSMKFILVEKN